MYLEKKRERRHRRRDYIRKWREQKLENMDPDERTEIIKRINRNKFN